MPRAKSSRTSGEISGKLRIGDDWNAITIIALSQSNPLKAIAEFVENSIDAGASHITVTRGREKGEAYISVMDDGEGIRKNQEGIPDFKYVATHICDSMKRHLRQDNRKAVQGEFGIGLLSFWTLGEELTLTCASNDGDTWEMRMRKGDTDYHVRKRRSLFPGSGTELKIKPLLSGLRGISGEKLQWYLASELRDRIRKHHIDLRIVDRTARKNFRVEPREFDGRLIHQLPEVTTPDGDIYLELYLDDPSPDRKVGLYRNGTRVLDNIIELDDLKSNVWGSGYLEGIVDIPFLNLNPGTRLGVIRDRLFTRAWFALRRVEDSLEAIIDELKKAEDERASRKVLNSIRRAFREAMLALPAEEYDWFDIQREIDKRGGRNRTNGESGGEMSASSDETVSGESGGTPQREFFDFPGPLHSVRLSPASCVMQVETSRTLRAIARDRRNRFIDQGVSFSWQIVEGSVTLDQSDTEYVEVTASNEPHLARIKVLATQGDTVCESECLVTVTRSLDERTDSSSTSATGLPGYTFQKAAGELWRSRYDEAQNVIVVNNGHRDFVFASRSHALQLRYISRLFAKELVYKNFPGLPADKLLERMIELSLYTEENLK